MTQRRILLKTLCKKAGSCCGGGSKPKNRYTVITIESEDGSEWDIIDQTSTTSNVMTLSTKTKKKYGGLWKGSVYTMDLHKDEEFVAKLVKCSLMKKGCTIIE